MKFPKPHTLKEIAELIGSTFVGPADFPVLGINEIHVVAPGDIVFVDHPKYYDKALQSKATVVLINKEVDCPEGKALLISVQPNVFIGNNVTVGRNCTIHANVSIYDHCVLGDNVTIHAGTVLGADAFYYKKRPEGFDQLLSGGRVIVEDDVHVGAGCTIDRGVTGDTTLGKGTKLDNQIQIGHDTVLGKKCLIASHTGIAGCVVLEDEVTLWGQVGVISGITIGKGATVLAQSGVGNSLEGGKTYFGSPAAEAREKMRELASIKSLPSLVKKMNKN